MTSRPNGFILNVFDLETFWSRNDVLVNNNVTEETESWQPCFYKTCSFFYKRVIFLFLLIVSDQLNIIKYYFIKLITTVIQAF